MFSFSLQIAIFALTISSVKSRVVVESTPQDHVTFAKCALYMTQRYISTRTNNLFITENCVNCTAMKQEFHTRLFDYYLRNFHARMSLQLHFDDGNDDEQPVNYNIFIINNALAFKLKKVYFYFKRNMHEPEFFFLILLTHEARSDIELSFEMRDIFEKCVKFNILNAVIMIQEPSGSVAFFTFNLFREDCVRRISITKCNSYSQTGVLDNDHLFPLRLRNFYNCTLHLALRVLPPLLYFDGDMNNTQHLREMQHLNGIEGDLIRCLAKILNFQVEFHFANDPRNRSTCLQMLQQRKADIAIGGLSASAPRRRTYTASVSYYHTSLVFAVYSGLHFGPIKQLLIEFRTSVWLLLALTILLPLLVLKRFRSNNINLNIRTDFVETNKASARFDFIATLLGNPITHVPRTNVLRFTFLTWLAMTMVLRCAYQAKMFDALRLSRRLPIPKGFNDLLRQDYVILGSRMYDFYPENRTAVLNSCTEFEKCFALIQTLKGKFTTPSILDNLAYHNRINFNTSNMTYVREPIYDFQQVFYFQKHSVLKWTFDKKLKQLMSAGIIANFAKRHVKEEFLMLNVRGSFVPQISSRTLSGLYMIYSFAMAIAAFCFLLELLSGKPKYVRLRKWFEN